MFSDHNWIKLKFNKRKRAKKIYKYLIITNTLINNTEIIENISKHIEKYFTLNENKNTTYWNLLTIVKAKMLMGTFIALNTYIRK